jgi:phosphonate transport system substrate-binding protein
MKKIALIVSLLSMGLGLAFAVDAKPLVFAWYPNESGEDMKPAREAIAKVVEAATGRKVTHKLTTDYTIAIESIANGNAHLGFFGAEGYIEANRKNQKVQPLVVNSDNKGTLKDAKYFSFLAVKLGNEGQYKNGAEYAIDNIQGKKFSWVSTSSTSGFKVPSAGIVGYFSKQAKWAKLKAADLLEGGSDKFFSEVMFGQSHQGSAVNLLTGKVDVAAFNDTNLFNYVDLVAGEENMVGAVYQVKADAADPFSSLAGQKYFVIRVMPVLNAPVIINTGLFSADEVKRIREALTSEAVAKNTEIFVPKDSSFKGMYPAGQRFLPVEDAWYNPIRLLSK